MDQVAFEILGLTVYWYGILAAVGFLTGFGIASKRAPLENLSREAIMNLAPWIIFGAIIGARLMYVINYWEQDFAGKPLHRIITIGRSGLVFYGGLIGSCLGTIIYTWKNKLPLWKVADVMAPSVALGHGFGRIGCLMTGCCYGRPTDLPWAIHFPKEHATGGIGVHPTQIYESALNFFFFAFLIWVHRRKKFDGQVFCVYLLGYAILRAFVESFRGDYNISYFAGLTPGQGTSVLIVAIAGALWWWLSGRKPSAAAA